MIPLLLVLADAAQATPAVPETTRWSLGITANVAATSSTYPSPASSSGGVNSNGNVDVTRYLGLPLVDDDSPRSLQPFLQRTSYVELGAGGLYDEAGYSPAAGGGTYTQYFTPEAVSGRIFLHPQIAILASLGLDYLHDHYDPDRGTGNVRNIWEPYGSVGIDARAGDASLTLQWQLVGVDETSGGVTAWRSVFWPRLTLGGRLVLDHRYDLTASVALIPDGVEVRGGIAWYPSKDLGLSLSAQADHGQIYWESSTDYDSVRGGPAVSYWLSSRTALALSYTPTWINSSQATTWSQAVALTFTARLP